MLEILPLAIELVRIDIDRLDRRREDPSRTRCAPTAPPIPQAISRRSRRRAATTASAATAERDRCHQPKRRHHHVHVHVARAPDGAARGVEQAEAIEDVAGGRSKRDARRGSSRAQMLSLRASRRRAAPSRGTPRARPRALLGRAATASAMTEDRMHDRLEQRQPKHVEADVAAEQRIREPEAPAVEEADRVVPDPGEADRNEERQQRPAAPGAAGPTVRAGRVPGRSGAPVAWRQPSINRRAQRRLSQNVERQREEGRGEQREAQIDDLPEHGPIAERSHPEPVDGALGQPERRDECQKAADDPPAQSPRRWAGWSR